MNYSNDEKKAIFLHVIKNSPPVVDNCEKTGIVASSTTAALSNGVSSSLSGAKQAHHQHALLGNSNARKLSDAQENEIYQYINQRTTNNIPLLRRDLIVYVNRKFSVNVTNKWLNSYWKRNNDRVVVRKMKTSKVSLR